MTRQPFRLDHYDAVIDSAFGRWAAGLPPRLRDVALALPHRLGHSSVARWRTWRDVFPTAAVRALPGMVAEGFPQVSRARRDHLWIAYILIWFLALMDDATLDAQVAFSRETNLLRRALDLELQAHLALAVGRDPFLARFIRRAFCAYAAGHRDEATRWDSSPAAPSRARFIRETVTKAAPATIPLVALGRLGGASPRALARLTRLGAHFFLALQYRDDLTDWEEDFRAGRRTYFLERHGQAGDGHGRQPIAVGELRQRVGSATVTEEFLRRAAAHYQACGRIGAQLSLPTLHQSAVAQAAAMRAAADQHRRAQRAARAQFARALQHRWNVDQ
jgi:hypothetical protein